MYSLVRWFAVEKIVATRGYFYFFIAAHQAHIVPKRAFASEQDAEAFFERARELAKEAAIVIEPRL